MTKDKTWYFFKFCSKCGCKFHPTGRWNCLCGSCLDRAYKEKRCRKRIVSKTAIRKFFG